MAAIVVSEFMDEAALAGLRATREVLFDPTLVDDRPRLLAELAGAEALIVRNRTQVDKALLEAAPALRVVGRLGVGLDNIDVEACKARGIAVHPATGANDLAVAEYVITTAMMLLRRAYFAGPRMIAGAWPRAELMGHELSGKVMGLVGFGAIAREVGSRARALGMEVAAFDPYVAPQEPVWEGTRKLELEALLEAADVVSLHVPLTDGTRHLIGEGALTRMKRGAILINAARGGVVDEAALAASLKSGKLGGAALDVFETEPLTAEAGAKFEGIDNLILTPHIAGVTQESNVRVSAVTAEAVRRTLDG